MKIFWSLFLSLICSLFTIHCSLLWAEEKIKIEEVVVTASRMEEPLEETTSSVVVIKEEDIKRMNVNFIPDVLRRVPEMNIVQNGGEGKLTSVFLRGGSPTATLVLIDGIKMNSPTAGVFDFSSISVDDIERIEIVKGPQSTVYGSEAMAGVINIITKKGEGKPKADLLLEGGSFGTYKGAVTASGSLKNLDYRITSSYFHTDGISAAADGTERDEYRNAYLSWKLGAKPSKNSELEVFGNYYYDRTELDGFDFATGRAADALNFIQSAHHFLLAARGKLYLLDKWEQILSVSTYRDEFEFRDPDTAFNNADVINKRQVLDWQHNLYLTNSLTLTGGFEFRNDEGENKGNFEDSIDNKAFYLMGKVKAFDDRLIVTAGLRHDDHETAGNKTTYRLGAVYHIKSADLSVRGSYATGFRAPSLDELFFPFFGNPSLKPEESKAFEVGIEKRFLKERASIAVTYFKQDYDDLIQFDFATFAVANVAKAEVEGVEVVGSFKVTDTLGLRAGYTNLDAKDEVTGERLTRRPKDKLNVGIDYSYRDLSASADLLYVGKRFDSATNTDLASYVVVNVSGTYKVTKNIAAFARIENLFDKDYEEAGGFGTRGASVFGGVRLSL